MTSFLPELNAIDSYLQTAIAANLDYDQMSELEKDEFRRTVLKQCENVIKSTRKIPDPGTYKS